MSLINSICIILTIPYGLWWIVKFIVQETVYRKYFKLGNRFELLFNEKPFKYFLIQADKVNLKTVFGNLFFTIFAPLAWLFSSTELVYLIASKAEAIGWVMELPFIIAFIYCTYYSVKIDVIRIKRYGGLGRWLSGYLNIMKTKIKK